ncbi:MAG: flagellar protein FlbD [Mycobacterium sp.]|jgi:flagellar protein FlbD|nr:flagellar protein FlbD [Mycobacterium sp.]MCW2744646.1 flagellar protein FlbD [Mycobacterium sp.]
MIRLTRLNGTEMFLNADLIATVESRPDTVITLVDGKHFVVAEEAAAVVALVTRYRAEVLALADKVAEQTAEQTDDAAPRSGQLYVLPNAAGESGTGGR